MVIQDDTYEGYFIPKDTILIPNLWQICQDEDEFDRPDEFMPERFLNNKFGTRYEVDEKASEHRRQTYASVPADGFVLVNIWHKMHLYVSYCSSLIGPY